MNWPVLLLSTVVALTSRTKLLDSIGPSIWSCQYQDTAINEVNEENSYAHSSCDVKVARLAVLFANSSFGEKLIRHVDVHRCAGNFSTSCFMVTAQLQDGILP